MRTDEWSQRLLRIVMACLVIVLGGGIALPGAARSGQIELPAQLVLPGDTVVEMERPLAVDLSSLRKGRYGLRLERAVHSVVPSFVVTNYPPDPTVEIHFDDPAVGEKVYRATASPVEISIPAGPVRTAHYWLSLCDPAGVYEMRIPSGGHSFEVSIVPRWPSLVTTGTGDIERVVFGDSIPIFVALTDHDGIRDATVEYRSGDDTSITTEPLIRRSGDAAAGEWRAAVPRPAGLDVWLSYDITIHNTKGRVTRYGTQEHPHHVHLLDPTLPSGE